MISFPINLRSGQSEDQPAQKLIGEDGFPHSEIVGSKVAHTSPTLIAACHVLHRLCMPRHPPNALTSRLRTRTTNSNPDQFPSKQALMGPNQTHYRRCGNTLSINQFLKHTSPPSSSRKLRKKMRPASISRTHSQCQRRRVTRAYRQAGSGSFIWSFLFGLKRRRSHPLPRLSSHKRWRSQHGVLASTSSGGRSALRNATRSGAKL